MNKLLILLMILTGCGGNYVESTDFYCDIKELRSYTLEFDLDCNMIQEEVSLAMEVLDSWNLVPRSKQDTFKNVTVKVHKEWCIENWGVCSVGLYSWFPNAHIDLGFRRQSIVHELLHHWDSTHLAIGTQWHENWETNGYDDSEQLEFVPRLKEIWKKYGYEPLY